MGADTNRVNRPGQKQPCCAVLTPVGRGAIATIAISGVHAAALIGQCFRPASGKRLEDYVAGSVIFGRFQTAAAAAEELIVGGIADDSWEIHCHGGTAAVAAIVATLVAVGCQAITAAEWTARQEADAIAAEALIALGSARTERTAAILLDQYRGALRHELATIHKHLQACDRDQAAEQIGGLLAWSDVGRHLTRPWRVVLAGRPNAGKSSLMNAIVGYQRSIVFVEPGTTRDVLTASTAVEGWPIELADTAGLRTADDLLEASGVERAEREAATADLVIFVADTTKSWDGELYKRICRSNVESSGAADLSRVCRQPLIVHNKCDLTPVPVDGRPTGLEVSAKTNVGVEELCRAIARSLVREAPPQGTAVPFTTQQIETLHRTRDHLRDGERELAEATIKSLISSPII